MNELKLVSVASLGLAGPGAILYFLALEKAVSFETALEKAPIINIIFWLLWMLVH